MQGEKSTCLPYQTADSLPLILVLDSLEQHVVYTFTQTKNMQPIRNNTTNSKNRERYGDKGIVCVARIL